MKANENLKDLARTAKNNYAREWRKKNPEKIRKYTENHWLKKAEEMLAAEKEATKK